MTDMTKRREEMAENAFANLNPYIDQHKAKVFGFKKGWDARDAIANEQLKAKDAVIAELLKDKKNE